MSYSITTADGISHQLPALNAEAIAAYTTSANTAAALETAIAADNYVEVPDPDPSEPEPNPSTFRSALASSPTWLAWAETLSSVAYTNLTIAAAQGNWAEAQAIYDRLIDNSLPPTGAAAEWQGLADANGIPITF